MDMIRYIKAQGKRYGTVLLRFLVLSLILFAALGGIVLALTSADSSREDKQKITIGIVGDSSVSYLGFGIQAIQTIDSSRFVVTLEEMDEEHARRLLKKGEIAAYAVIPAEFIEAAVHGEIKKIRYVTTANSVGITEMFKDEMLEAISCMLVESQNGIYAMQRAAGRYGILEDFTKNTDMLNASYFRLILNRTEAIRQEIIGFSDDLSIGGTLFCGMLLLWMLLCAVPLGTVFIKKEMALPKLLYANGLGAGKQVLAEYTVYLSGFLVNTLAVFLLLGCISGIGDGQLLDPLIPELTGIGIGEWALLFVKLMPVLFMMTALQVLMFEVSSNLVNGILGMFVTSLGLAYVSGYLYPIRFLPDSVQAMAAVLPTGLAREYLASAVSGNSMLRSGICLCIYGVLLLAAAVFVRFGRLHLE